MNTTKSTNEFLPASAGPRPHGDNAEEDEFDMAKFSAIRKEQKDELERLERHHHNKQAVIEGQIREQLDRLFQHFQQGMQSLYTGLTQTAHATVEAQVKLRMQQERLREEHAANKREVERRYHNEASRLVMSTSHATRHPHSFHKIPSSAPRTTPTVPSNNGDHLVSQAASSAITTPPVRQQVIPKPVHSDTIREFIVQDPACRDYVAPYPTPLEPAPKQRKPVPSEARPVEPRPLEPRQVEPRQIEPRPMQPVAARPIYDEPKPIEPQPPTHATPSHQVRHIPEALDMTPSRQEAKRKAIESPANDEAAVGPHSKRPRTRDRPVEEVQGPMSSPLKRSPRTRRSSQTAIEKRIERTVTFDEVYQNGKAQYKHKIFEWKLGSGNWYIVRCDEHQVHFGFGNPVHGAAKHVHSPQHGNLEKRHDLAIDICGHRVLGCNAELAELNNREFERALREDKYIVFNMNLLTKEGRRRLTDRAENLASGENPAKKKSKPSTPTKSRDEVVVPQEGKFYQGLWAPTKKWYMLIVLPIRPDGSLREVGLREKLQETQLMSNVPKCYRVDRISLLIKGWQPAYEDGGPKVDKREYPVMFFDGHQRHSLGWLTAQKLREVDLDNPPENVDRRGLTIAREWYSQHMMHRKNWEDFKRLGPGEPSSASPSEDLPEQWPSLRSANADNQSPIQDRPGHFGFGSSSDSEEEDPMSMDLGPIPEPQDPNYVAESGSDDDNSDVEMEDARRGDDSDNEDVMRPRRRASVTLEAKSKTSSRPSSRRGPVSEMSMDGEAADKETPATEKDDVEVEGPASQRVQPGEERPDESKRASASTEAGDQRGLSSVLSEQEDLRKSAQAKAAAAVKEAASRSRASSEVPDGVPRPHALSSQQHSYDAPPRATHPSRPPFAEHQRSRSDDLSRSQAGAPRKPLDLHNILNTDHAHAAARETHVDPYKQYEAIKAQMAMNGLENRSASAPVHEAHLTASSFRPPSIQPVPNGPSNAPQHSPPLTHMLSPPSQSSTMVPARSSSSTPVQGSESGHSTPKIVIPGAGNSDKWQAVHSFSAASPPQQSQTPHASFVGMPSLVSGQASQNSQNNATAKTAPARPPPSREVATPTAQLGTPIPDKMESFDVAQFRDTAHGVRWSRDSPASPFLRLNTDPMRGWAETPAGSPLTAAVEPLKVSRIEVDAPSGDKGTQRVQLTLKDGNEQVLVFETNSAGGRAQTAALQGRRFVSWVKKMNSEVDYRNGTGSRRSSLHDERRSATAEAIF